MKSQEIQDVVDACKAEHGRVASLQIEGRLFVFRKPKGAEFKRFSREVDSDTSLAAFNLAAAAMVYPKENQLAATQWLEDEYAAALMALARKLQELAGSEVAVQIEGN